MNPFEQRPHDASDAYRQQSQQQQQQQGQQNNGPNRQSLPPLSIPRPGSGPHPSQSPPPQQYNQGHGSSGGGGSFSQYAPPQQQQQQQHGPQRPAPVPMTQGYRPGSGPGASSSGQVTFQMPQGGNSYRGTPSRESVKHDIYGGGGGGGGGGGDNKRSSGPQGASMANLPELRRGDSHDAEMAAGRSGFSGADFKRKKSLVRPDRERMDPNHRQWYYRNHAAQLDAVDSAGRPAHHVGYMPSTTGHMPQHGAALPGHGVGHLQGPGGGISGLGMMQGLPPHAAPHGAPLPGGAVHGPGGPHMAGQAAAPGAFSQGHPPSNIPPGGLGRAPPLRRGKSILGRDEDQVETGINFLKRGMSLRRSRSQSRKELPRDWAASEKPSKVSTIAPGPVGPWMIYCYALTICCPRPCLGIFGIKTPEQQRAWREKMGILSIVLICMAAVGFITFGFTQAVCDTSATRYLASNIDVGSMTFHGYDFDFNTFFHPQVGPFNAGGPWARLNPVYSEPFSSGRLDGSMIMQRGGGECAGLIKNKDGTDAQHFYPCILVTQNGTQTYQNSTMCHDTTVADKMLNKMSTAKFQGPVYYTWDQIEDPSRNLLVWKGSVLDLGRLGRMYTNNLTYPAVFDTLKNRNESWAGRDVTSSVFRSKQDQVFNCLERVTRVGFIDSSSIGCIASKVELVVALVFILGVVGIKFIMAVIFGWFLSWRLGNYGNESREQRKKRQEEIEDWSDNIYRPAPASYRPNARKHRSFLPTTSRFSTGAALGKTLGPRGILSEKGTGARSPASRNKLGVSSPVGGSPPASPSLRGIRSSASLVNGGNERGTSFAPTSRRSSFSNDPMIGAMGACPWPLEHVVPQPPSDYMPFNFPLAHSICLVTAYSESFEGLRTTLDSLATTDYPNSHKVILVIADGIVKGAGSDLSTPDICLSMMKEFIVPPEEVEGNSYVAIADGYKRHNMAKVYAGFYEYDDETVERSKQQRVPMVLVAKCGSPMEADSAKPGNRGKRDSQVLLMAFLQKVMFDERMTTFEYEFFNLLWRVTGVSPDHYEIILMVDADTKVFPDSLTRMVACMVEDPEIMGLCGETKIANKRETWVTMIQVFEYYISHHQTKAFEACFGGVTCLPGCFSAYRIKSPKGGAGYWVPILANPDIVEHYSENVVDTLHKKNLLLLGEDRFLTTLMLKTFPKRKMMFVPQAVCKTVVPDTFRILLSQRRRWINSTVHNLAELVMVNDLCGTFCFSMRFVVFMELAGTLVLPAAIAFTLYVVISAVIDAGSGKKVEAIPLILLAVILGLPGVLIIVTTRKIAYVGWMLVYLCSLPIWNFVFPSYAFWHMDDFSWGATRVIQGEVKGDHSDAEGKFDPSNITMKRWIEFERDRRLATGTHSRDSTYDIVQMGSPDRAGSTRYSVVSSSMGGHSEVPTPMQTERLLSSLGSHNLESSEGGHTRAGSSVGGGGPAPNGARARIDAVPLLSLPAPLGDPNAAKQMGAPGSITVPRPRDASPTSYANRPPYEPYPSTTADDEKQPMISAPSATSSPDPERDNRPGYSGAEFAAHLSAEPDEASSGVSPSAPPSLPQSISGVGPRPRENAPTGQRGFSLVDDGPAGATPRVVQRGARRMSTNDGAAPRFSKSTEGGNSSNHNNNPFHR
ncbi:unnamed protein product [Sympodiomycopsis kandeliae]